MHDTGTTTKEDKEMEYGACVAVNTQVATRPFAFVVEPGLSIALEIDSVKIWDEYDMIIESIK